MKEFYRNLVIKIHHILFKDVYKNIPSEFKNFPILESIRLMIKASESKLEKLEKSRLKFTNEMLKKISEFDDRNKLLKSNLEKLSYKIDQNDIQINRLKNLKK